MIGSSSRCGRLLRSLAIGLSFAVAATPVSVCFADSAASAPPPADLTGVAGVHTIAVFPAANDADASGDIVASALDSAVMFRLNASGVYQATEVSSRLPAIQRAEASVTTGTALTSADLTPPFTSTATAQRIARVMDTNAFLLEEVDAYKEDPATHDVSVTVSGSLYSTDSGSAVRTFAVTGTSSQTAADEGAATQMQAAVNSAAEQVVESLGAPPQGSATLPNSKIGSKHKSNSLLLIVLAGALAGIIASSVTSHGNSGTSSPGGTNVPPVGTGTSSGPPAPP